MSKVMRYLPKKQSPILNSNGDFKLTASSIDISQNNNDTKDVQDEEIEKEGRSILRRSL